VGTGPVQNTICTFLHSRAWLLSQPVESKGSESVLGVFWTALRGEGNLAKRDSQGLNMVSYDLIWTQADPSESSFLHWEADLGGNAGSVLVVDLVEVSDESLLDVTTALAERAGEVLNQVSAVGVVVDLSEEGARLLVVVVRVLVWVSADSAADWVSMDGVLLVLNWAEVGLWLVIWLAAIVAIDAHGAITDIVSTEACSKWAVNWDLLVVWSETMSVGVWVVEESALEHLVVGWLNSWHQVRWGEGDLLGFGMVVLWVTVESDSADLLEWVVTVWPDLGDVVDVEAVVISVGDWHHLDVPGPRGGASVSDVVVQVSGGEVLVLDTLGCGLCGSEVLDSGVSLEVVLHEEGLAFGIDPLEGVRAVAIHVAVAVWGSSVGEEDGDLVESLWRVAPEVEGHVRVLDSSLWVSLLAVDKVWELHRVLDEEDWGVVANHVVVALFGVELDGESTWVAVAVVGTALAGDGRESEEDGGSLSDLVEEGCLGESRTKQKIKD
jgi:hypothetical protein